MKLHRSVPEKCLEYEGAVTVKMPVFRELVKSVRPFCTDDQRASLTCVWIAVRKGRVHAMAFNPYCMAYNSTVLPDREAAFDGPIPSSIVDLFLRETKKDKDREVTLTCNATHGILRYQSGEHNVERTWLLRGLTPPDGQQAVPKGKPEGTASIGVNLMFLEICSKVMPMARLRFRGAVAPIEVVGINDSDTFYAVIMPLRLPSDE